MKVLTVLEAKVDEVLALYVNGTSAAVSGYAGGIAAVGLTIYFVYMSYAAARGDLTEPFSKLTKDLMKIALVLTVALGGGAYQQYVIGFAHGIISDLTSVVTLGEAKTVGAAIDYANSGCVVIPGKPECISYEGVFLNLAVGKANWMGIPDPLYTICFFAVVLAQLTISVLCILPVLLAKIGLAVMLGIGPIFVLLALFPITTKYFESWLAALIGFVLTQVIVAAICSVIPMIFKGLLDTAIQEGIKGDVSVLSDALAVLIAAIGLGLTAMHASQKGAQLAGGGVSMDSKGLGGMAAQSFLNRIIQGRIGGNPAGVAAVASQKPQNSASSEPGSGYATGHAAGRAPYNAGRVVGNILSALDKKRGK